MTSDPTPLRSSILQQQSQLGRADTITNCCVGSIGLIFALTLMLLIVGLLVVTVDLNLSETRSGKNQNAVDAAALGIAEYIVRYRFANANANPSNYVDQALAFFKANLKGAVAASDISKFNVTLDNSKVEVDACLTIRNEITIGSSSSEVCNTATAQLGNALGNAEIVFAVDVSASMNQTIPVKVANTTVNIKKIVALEDAVTSTLDDYLAAYGKNGRIDGVFWGVVPFRGMVNLGSNYSTIVDDDWNSANFAKDPFEIDLTAAPDSDKYYVTYDAAQRLTSPGPRIMNRIPLTERTNGLALLDDASPDSNRFKAYWHHDLKYWYQYTSVNSCASSCGSYTAEEVVDAVGSPWCGGGAASTAPAGGDGGTGGGG